MIQLERLSRTKRKSPTGPPLLLRQVEWERYDPHNPFPLYDPVSSGKKVKPKVPVLTIRRATYLWGLLAWLLPYAAVDDFNVLPAAIVIYSMGICYLRELLCEAEEINLAILRTEQEALERRRKHDQENFQRHYDRAMFELQVMQGRTNVRLVTRVEDGITKIYAIN